MRTAEPPLNWRNVGLLVLVLARGAIAAEVLQNETLRVDFNRGMIASMTDRGAGRAFHFAEDGLAAFVGNESLEGDYLVPVLESESPTNRVYRLESGPWTARITYELQPGWHFLSRQVALSGTEKKESRVRRFELFRGRFADPVAGRQRVRDGTLIRFAAGTGAEPDSGLFFVLQNPFAQVKQQGARLSLAYPPDLTWNPTNGVHVSDRLLIGPYRLSGFRSPARMVPEWKLAPETAAAAEPWIDRAEVDALVECVRAFLLWRPTRTTRVNVGWCENDYQIDIGTPEGRSEYRRIIDQAAAIGCRDILFAPANSEVSSLAENRDAWGWENLLWFSMGQKLRRGEWDPARDPLPASIRELVDYGRSKDIGFLAYVYPSLPFLQDPAWTSWVPGGKPGGYLGADTGQRSFQDWLLDRLVAFRGSTGAAGFAFDHWWIAYDETPSGRYAQWAGCRRILEELRRRLPDVVVDGRQQYHHFGAWTWLAGTYPHPLNSDEQPESFRAFPDLHWSRVSADRQRRTAYLYRTEWFVPAEIMPGYMTHQTPRLTATGECPRGRFRAADWDLLGWKYSVISSIATAPFNLVVNFIPARDEREFRAFPAEDQRWFRDWFDWTDQNLEILRRVKPILGAPQLGRVDGTAAFRNGHGFVFLFNPNYGARTAAFRLDESIGLAGSHTLMVRQQYPDRERGRLVGPPGRAFWRTGDTVTLPLAGTEACVLEVSPAPERIDEPLLVGAPGRAVLSGERLELTGVTGEPGTSRDLIVAVPGNRSVSAATVNGSAIGFRRNGELVSLSVHFAGVAFPARARIGTHDPTFAGGTFRAEMVIPVRVFEQLAARKQRWPVDYSAEERAATWLNSDRLLVFLSVADPDDEAMKGVTLKVDGIPVQLRPAYSSIVRSNPRNTFVGWYADLSGLKPDVPHEFEAQLPKLTPGEFQGMFLDTVEAESTERIVGLTQ